MTRSLFSVALAVVVVLACLAREDRADGQEVRPRLKEVDVYTETPIRGQPFYALKQRSLSPSDSRGTIYNEWLLPRLGHYTVRYQIYGPSGALYLANTHPFDALEQTWPTWLSFVLPRRESFNNSYGRAHDRPPPYFPSFVRRGKGR